MGHLSQSPAAREEHFQQCPGLSRELEKALDEVAQVPTGPGLVPGRCPLPACLRRRGRVSHDELVDEEPEVDKAEDEDERAAPQRAAEV